jgi:hypothetical protein
MPVRQSMDLEFGHNANKTLAVQNRYKEIFTCVKISRLTLRETKSIVPGIRACSAECKLFTPSLIGRFAIAAPARIAYSGSSLLNKSGTSIAAFR